MQKIHGKKKNNSECKFDGIKDNRLIKIKDNGNLNLLLRKGVYPYEDMDNWEKFNETTTLPKEAFYSKLNLVGISDANYVHAQKVWEENIMTYMLKVIHYRSLMCLKTLEISVLK